MKETKKQIKAQLVNEIAKQYAKREESLKERICFLEERQIRANSRIAELEKENIELKDKVEQYEDWIRRLQEFMDMEPDARDKAIADLKVRSEISQNMKGVMDFYSRFMFL